MLAKMDFALLWLRSWTQTTVESASAWRSAIPKRLASDLKIFACLIKKNTIWKRGISNPKTPRKIQMYYIEPTSRIRRKTNEKQNKKSKVCCPWVQIDCKQPSLVIEFPCNARFVYVRSSSSSAGARQFLGPPPPLARATVVMDAFVVQCSNFKSIIISRFQIPSRWFRWSWRHVARFSCAATSRVSLPMNSAKAEKQQLYDRRTVGSG